MKSKTKRLTQQHGTKEFIKSLPTHEKKLSKSARRQVFIVPERSLTTQEEIAARVEADPKAALYAAWNLMEYGFGMLLKLIESKRLFVELKSVDGTEDYSWDEAVSLLLPRVAWINRSVAELAQRGDGASLIHVWCDAKQFVEVIHHIAQTDPKRLKLLASDSLFLPSLRARSKTFTHDFDSIAKAIELSESCIVNMDAKAMHQLDKPATRLVAEILEEVAWRQRDAKHEEETLQRFKRAADEVPGGVWEKYRHVQVERFITEHNPHMLEILIYWKLPPFNKKTVPVWWRDAVKPYLEKPETLDRIRGTAFYDSLCRATEAGKDYQVRDELKRRCKPKLASLAKPA